MTTEARCPFSGRKSEPVINPVDESVLGDLPHASQADLQAALAAAQAAFAGWKRTSPLARSDILRKAAGLIRERVEHIATCMTLRSSLALVLFGGTSRRLK